MGLQPSARNTGGEIADTWPGAGRSGSLHGGPRRRKGEECAGRRWRGRLAIVVRLIVTPALGRMEQKSALSRSP